MKGEATSRDSVDALHENNLVMQDMFRHAPLGGGDGLYESKVRPFLIHMARCPARRRLFLAVLARDGKMHKFFNDNNIGYRAYLEDQLSIDALDLEGTAEELGEDEVVLDDAEDEDALGGNMPARADVPGDAEGKTLVRLLRLPHESNRQMGKRDMMKRFVLFGPVLEQTVLLMRRTLKGNALKTLDKIAVPHATYAHAAAVLQAQEPVYQAHRNADLMYLTGGEELYIALTTYALLKEIANPPLPDEAAPVAPVDDEARICETLERQVAAHALPRLRAIRESKGKDVTKVASLLVNPRRSVKLLDEGQAAVAYVSKQDAIAHVVDLVEAEIVRGRAAEEAAHGLGRSAQRRLVGGERRRR